jgi:hypothetical protein
MLAADYFDLAESLKMGRTFKGDETTALPVQLLIKLACRSQGAEPNSAGRRRQWN